jgi:gentisate 1,2-dioxygenase
VDVAGEAKLVTPEPVSGCQPASWSFAEIRGAMIEAGVLITAKEAERRVLILENPGLRGQSKITTDLYAGVQLVLPGEVAPAHRHSQSALRFVLEGDGAHTAVNGERTPMRYGDFIITRRWPGTTTARGFQTARYRSTDATIFVAVEGRGKTRIGADFVVEWGPRDIFVVPSWKPVVREASDEAVLFSFSDRPVQQALQLFREDRHSA